MPVAVANNKLKPSSASQPQWMKLEPLNTKMGITLIALALSIGAATGPLFTMRSVADGVGLLIGANRSHNKQMLGTASQLRIPGSSHSILVLAGRMVGTVLRTVRGRLGEASLPSPAKELMTLRGDWTLI